MTDWQERLAYRWQYIEENGVPEGKWWARPLRKGYNRRPHFYADGADQPICGTPGAGGPKGREYNPETGRTLAEDERDAPVYRRPCEVCREMTKEAAR